MSKKFETLSKIGLLRMGETIIAKDCSGDGLPIYSANKGNKPWAHSDHFRCKNERGCIVIGARGTIGYPRLPKDELFGATQTTIVFSPDKDHFIPEFLHYSLQQVDFESLGAQQAIPMLTVSNLENLTIRSFKKPEQSKIAKILTTVDQAIEQTEALIAKQQRTKTGLMQDLLTRGIDEDGNLRSEDTHEFKDSPFGRIPVEWVVKELSDFCDVTSSKRIYLHDYNTEGIPFYRSKEIIELVREGKTLGGLYITKSKYLAIKRIFGTPNKGDVLISSVGTLGICYLVRDNDRFYFKDGNLIWLRRFQKHMNRIFLIELLPRMINTQFDDLVIGTSQKAFTIEKLKRLKLYFPSTEEQNRLAVSVQQFQAKIDCEIQSLQKLRFLKTALMHDLLTGKVSVR